MSVLMLSYLPCLTLQLKLLLSCFGLSALYCMYLSTPDPARQPGSTPLLYSQHFPIWSMPTVWRFNSYRRPPFSYIGMIDLCPFSYSIGKVEGQAEYSMQFSISTDRPHICPTNSQVTITTFLCQSSSCQSMLINVPSTLKKLDYFILFISKVFIIAAGKMFYIFT